MKRAGTCCAVCDEKTAGVVGIRGGSSGDETALKVKTNSFSQRRCGRPAIRKDVPGLNSRAGIKSHRPVYFRRCWHRLRSTSLARSAGVAVVLARDLVIATEKRATDTAIEAVDNRNVLICQTIPPIRPRHGKNSTRLRTVFARAQNSQKTVPGLAETVKRQVDGP